MDPGGPLRAVSDESWHSELRVEVEDLGGGSRTLRIDCRLHAAEGTPRDTVEQLVTGALGGACGFAVSKYGMLPEHFLGREATIEKQGGPAIAAAAERRGVMAPRCEVLAVALE